MFCIWTLFNVVGRSGLWYKFGISRAVDPHSFFADLDPAVFLNADPDPDPAA